MITQTLSVWTVLQPTIACSGCEQHVSAAEAFSQPMLEREAEFLIPYFIYVITGGVDELSILIHSS